MTAAQLTLGALCLLTIVGLVTQTLVAHAGGVW